MMAIGSAAWQAIIAAGAGTLGTKVDARQLERFKRYAEELVRWNRKMNLTTITDPEALAVKHFLDSIAPAALIPPGALILDIGSGAGFPGIPLKIVRPDLDVTLIDAVRKKVNFQKHVIRTLGLENVGSRQCRAEEFCAEKPFEVIITRALSSLPQFVALALPLLAETGVMLVWKGRPAEAKTEVSNLLAGENKDRLSVKLKPYRIPGLAAERTIVLIKKGVRDSREQGFK